MIWKIFEIQRERGWSRKRRTSDIAAVRTNNDILTGDFSSNIVAQDHRAEYTKRVCHSGTIVILRIVAVPLDPAIRGLSKTGTSYPE
jgi:hypothetical protein